MAVMDATGAGLILLRIEAEDDSRHLAPIAAIGRSVEEAQIR